MHTAHDALAAAKDLAAQGEYAQAEAQAARLLVHYPHDHAAMHVLGVIAQYRPVELRDGVVARSTAVERIRANLSL